MHDWSRHLILSQSRVPLYEKYITAIYTLGSLQRRIVRQTLPNLVLFAAQNLICRTKLIQNAAVLPYLTHQ